MEIKLEIIEAGKKFFYMVEQFASTNVLQDFMDKQTLISINQGMNDYKMVDDFYQDLSYKGELQNFHEYVKENSKNSDVLNLFLSQFQAYRLQYLLWNSIRSKSVEDIDFAKEILSKGKIFDLIGDNKISSCFMSAITNSVFVKMEKNGNETKTVGAEHKVFSEIAKTTSEFKNYELSVAKMMSHSITPWDHLANTGSIIVAFNKKSHDLYDVNVMCLEEDDEALIELIYAVLGGCYNATDGLILLGTLNENFHEHAKNSEILASLFKVLARFKRIYVANTDTLYTNNFLNNLEEVKKIDAGVYEPEPSKYS